MSSFQIWNKLTGNEYVVGLGGSKNILLSLTKLRDFLKLGISTTYKGLAEAGTNPGTPTSPEWWRANGGVTYANFKDAGGIAITIPDEVGGLVVVDATLNYNGTSWEANYQLLDLNIETTNSRNLFDKQQAIENYQLYVDSGSGALINGIGSPGLNISRTGKIDVTGFGKVTISGLTIVANANAYRFEDISGTLISYGLITTSTQTLTVPDNAVGFYFNTQFNAGTYPPFYDNIQVERGSSATPYQSFESIAGLFGKTTYLPGFTFIKVPSGRNAFNKADVIIGQYVSNEGVITPISGLFSTTGKVFVRGLTKITLSNIPILSGFNYYVFFDKNLNKLSNGEFFTDPVTLNVPTGAEFFETNVRYNEPDTTYYNTIQIESGTEQTSYVPYSFENQIESVDGFKIYTATPENALLSNFYGKKLVVEGDSIMEQAFVTNNIAARTGAVVVVKAKSGSGYVQNASGTIRSRVNAITAENPDGILIAGGTNDWGNNIPLGSQSVLNDDTQFYSAVWNTFRILKEDNPIVPILVATPIVRNYGGVEPRGFLRNGRTLREFCDAIIWCAQQHSIEVCDLNYISGITYENIFDVASDGVHVGTEGGRMMAGKIVAQLNNLVIL